MIHHLGGVWHLPPLPTEVMRPPYRQRNLGIFNANASQFLEKYARYARQEHNQDRKIEIGPTRHEKSARMSETLRVCDRYRGRRQLPDGLDPPPELIHHLGGVVQTPP